MQYVPLLPFTYDTSLQILYHFGSSEAAKKCACILITPNESCDKLTCILKKKSWRPLYWFGACPPVLIIAFRLCLPETDAYIERERVRAAGDNVGKTFIKEGKVALKRHWLLLIYLVLLMAGMNFM